MKAYKDEVKLEKGVEVVVRGETRLLVDRVFVCSGGGFGSSPSGYGKVFGYWKSIGDTDEGSDYIYRSQVDEEATNTLRTDPSAFALNILDDVDAALDELEKAFGTNQVKTSEDEGEEYREVREALIGEANESWRETNPTRMLIVCSGRGGVDYAYCELTEDAKAVWKKVHGGRLPAKRKVFIIGRDCWLNDMLGISGPKEQLDLTRELKV